MRVRIPYAATIAAMLLVSQAAIAGDLFPNIVVTVAPLKPYVDEVLKGRGESQYLLRPGQEPHDFALSPSQAQMLEKADIVITPDLGMSPFLKRLLEGKKATVIQLTALPGADPLAYAMDNPWLDAMKAAQKAPVKKTKKTTDPKESRKDEKKPETAAPALTDPHLWLDPERMAAIAVPLAEKIAEKSPESKPALVNNARQLATHLRQQVLPALKDMLRKSAREANALGKAEIPFVTYHAAYQYFLGRFGLAHYGELVTRPQGMMGAWTSTLLIKGAETVRLRCLIGEQETGLMQRIASASGARVVVLSPEQLVARKDVDALDWIANDYDRFMYVTAKAFAGCL